MLWLAETRRRRLGIEIPKTSNLGRSMLTNADAPGSGPPTTNADGTITAVVAPPPDGGVYFDRVPLRLPRGALQSNAVAGRYFLARCGAQSDAEREQA